MKQTKSLRILVAASAIALASLQSLLACTGISFTAKDGCKIIGRTMEWGGFYMESHLVVVPRNYAQTAIVPSGQNGLRWKAKYGYFGIGVLEHNFIAEGMNEKGLAGELFYFPEYGSYEPYDPAKHSETLCDAQLLDWILSNFATIDEMEAALHGVRVVGYGHGFGAAHFNVADATGRQVVIEYIDGKLHIFENRVGVITNAPSFDWHLTNLNNYINLFAGDISPRMTLSGHTLKATGVGAAALGLPGDMTPPSRFVRAAFFVHSAIQRETGFETILQTFQILNNFDVPIGSEFSDKSKAPEFLSATQWTTALNLKERKFYYRTEWNYTIRCIDLAAIDFGKVKYQIRDLDQEAHPIEMVRF